MINAFLFVHLNQEFNDDTILDDVRAIPQVKEAYRLYGTYDMVIHMQTETTTELKETTLESVRKLRFVESTVTFIALESHFND